MIRYKCGDDEELWCKHNLCNGLTSKLFYNVQEAEFIIDDDDRINNSLLIILSFSSSFTEDSWKKW